MAWSGGSEPGFEINPAAIAAMTERGVDISGEFPKPWTDETVRAADVVITMGCGDACPIFPGKRYEDWPVDDPPGRIWTPCAASVTTWNAGSGPCSTSCACPPVSGSAGPRDAEVGGHRAVPGRRPTGTRCRTPAVCRVPRPAAPSGGP